MLLSGIVLLPEFRAASKHTQPGELGNGSESMLGDMAIYEPAGNPSSSMGVIVVYDVFAFKVANTRTQAHILKSQLYAGFVL